MSYKEQFQLKKRRYVKDRQKEYKDKNNKKGNSNY
jgi:hypothetical protein